MTTTETAGTTRTVLGRIGNWWKSRRERAATLRGLRSFDGEQLSQIAHDIGVSAGELVVLAGKWPDAASQVERRATALGIDTAAIKRAEPQTMRDLARVCSICGNKGACEHDLNRDPANPDWKDYCPNAETLEAIRETHKQTVS